MHKYLKEFQKRMEIFAVIDSIAKRRNRTDKIENLFEENQLDNIIMSVLVYIMDTTLTEEQECTQESIMQFISEILPAYGKKLSFNEIEELTRYIMKDILQNKGKKRNYEVMDYENGFKEVSVRLVTDKINKNNKVAFGLSKQGYDFLFRTKEVDDELGFEIEEIKLKMLIKKKDYQGAIRQSKDMLGMLMKKKIELVQFEEKLKKDINEISNSEYEELINNTNSVIQDEYKEMKEIEELITKAKEHLEQEEKIHQELDEKIKKAKSEVYTITKNVRKALSYQRQILIQAQNLKKLYLRTLEDTISFSNKKRYNFEEGMLQLLEKKEISSIDEITDIYEKLLNPLFIARAKKRLNLNLIYDSQSKIKEQQEEETIQDEEFEEDLRQKEEIERRNKIHIEIIEGIFKFISQGKNQFTFSEWFGSLEEEKKMQYAENKRVFLVMLKLYEIETISISEFLQEEAVNESGNGEFDLSYCLYQLLDIKEEKFDFDGFRVEKLEDIFKYSILKEEEKENIEINDIKFTIIGGK